MYLRHFHKAGVPESVWAPFLSYAQLDDKTAAFLNAIQRAPPPSARDWRIIELDRNGPPIMLQLAPVIDDMLHLDVQKKHLQAKGQMWKIKFKDEPGDDALGLTLETFAVAADSIFSEDSELVVRRPDRQCFIPFSTQHGAQVYHAIGTFIGMIIRNGWVQDLPFDDIVWKFIGSTQQLTREDILEADPSLMAQVTHWTEKNSAIWEFEMWNGDRTPLGTSGGQPVPPDKLGAYIDQVIHNRISSLKQFLEPMKAGFWENIGRAGQAQVTPEILKPLALGSGDVSVAELMAVTRIKEGEPVHPGELDRLKCVLERFSDVERRKFLIFVTACPRLPSPKLNPHFAILIVRKVLDPGQNPDNWLPGAHTCSARLDLPRYSSDDIAHEKIQIAITQCRTMEEA
jgi:hypothetical protein